jgi:hypothetical protein
MNEFSKLLCELDGMRVGNLQATIPGVPRPESRIPGCDKRVMRHQSRGTAPIDGGAV